MSVTAPRSIRCRSCEFRIRDPDTIVLGVEDSIEALDECHAVDEVEARARVGTRVADNKIDRIFIPANHEVESTLFRRKGKSLKLVTGGITHSWKYKNVRAKSARWR